MLQRSIVAVKNRAMLAVARLHAAAKGDEVFVGVHDDPFEGLCGLRIVNARVQRNPTPTEFATSADLAPRQLSTTHSVILRSLPFA